MPGVLLGDNQADIETHKLCHVHVQETVPAVVPPANGGPPLEDNFFSSDADVSVCITTPVFNKLQTQGPVVCL
jgi:hypothetical protein